MITGRPIGAGDLRETVYIKSSTEAQSGTGATTQTWSTLFTERAKVEPLRGAELARFQATAAQFDCRITIRDRGSTIKPEYQAVWGSRTFDILAAIPIGAEGRFIELMCKERFA